MNFSGKFGSASTIWYPASGSRYYVDGGLNNVGNNGTYWSASLYSYNAYNMDFYNHGYVNPSDCYGGCVIGRSVRCLQE